ncbi:MAG: proline dehydrogenase family protein [Halobacteriales archaeon]|nr:proline dehydrogenase family protein [Halobacteriales archaeon]
MIPPIASKFIAGETEATAIDHAKELNDRNVSAILNLLGEHYSRREPADADAETYCQLLDDIDAAGVDACVSVKPSQIGLDIGESAFRENLDRIVDRAIENDQFVWIDMEDHTTIGATLDAFEAAADRHPGGVGVCVQANMKRTREDLERLQDVEGKIRLVKGAYDPPKEIAYTEKARVDEAYESLLEYAFEAYEGGIAVGSHDPAMIERAEQLHEEYGTDFEIQMLMGVREDAQYDLATEYPVWQYVPYGSKWVSYFYRRLLERKENLLFGLRAVLNS